MKARMFLTSLEVFVCELPVDDVPPCLNVLGPRILVINVVGVFPHIASQDGSPALLAKRVAGVVGANHLQLAVSPLKSARE